MMVAIVGVLEEQGDIDQSVLHQATMLSLQRRGCSTSSTIVTVEALGIRQEPSFANRR